jgi:methylmalonyl-CoA mutase
MNIIADQGDFSKGMAPNAVQTPRSAPAPGLLGLVRSPYRRPDMPNDDVRAPVFAASPGRTAPYQARNKIRVVTAASLFDGHDAAIHLMRRLLQDAGAEVIHLGHDRSVEDVVVAAIQEDAHAVAISSYQGGHMEYFRYLRRLLDEGGAHRVRIFGGGGGVIVPEEIRELEAGVVDRIYSPEDGRRLGLEGMILDLLSRCAFDARGDAPPAPADVEAGAEPALARLITWCEAGVLPDDWRERLLSAPRSVPVIGITGTGGAGQDRRSPTSSLRAWLRSTPIRGAWP